MKSSIRIVLTCIVCLVLVFLSGLPVLAGEDSTEVDLHVRVVGPPLVITGPANGAGAKKATLNGYLTGLGTASQVNVSFGWDTESHAGDPEAYAHWTPPQIKRWPGRFKKRIDWLRPGTTYYFRAKAEGDSTSYGEELSFTTRPPGHWWGNHWWDRCRYWWSKRPWWGK
jgi:hypothetical protein